jgi:ATP-binding cassette subfamily B protein
MSSLRRMGRFVRPYTWVSFFLVITVILPVAMELAVPRVLGFVIDQGIIPGDMQAILRGTAVMLILAFAGAVATLGQGVCRALLSQGLAYDMRSDLFAHIQTFSFANLDQMQTGQLMTRISSDVDLVRQFIGHGLALILRFGLMIIGSMIMLFIIDWQLALIILVIMPLAVFIIWLVLRVAQPLFTIVQEKLSKLNTVVQENLSGAQVVKAFVRERFEIGRFQSINSEYMDQHIKVGRIMAIALPVLTLITNLGLVAVIWFGGLSTINGRLSLGELVAFINYLLIGMAPVMILGNMLTMVSQAEASSSRIWELLDTRPIIRQAVAPHKAPTISGAVTFSAVSFKYDGVASTLHDSVSGSSRNTGGLDVLNKISFNVTPGQRVALLGATGSGKSSLVNLIPRFYDADDGQVSIDGIDIRQWDLQTLRQQIGVVLQQTTLFSGTVRDNIAFGRPGASMPEVAAAAKAAQAHDFILRMPEGYDSQVVERGANLSGGQKQRIAIARALLISPAILILDDSTSAVDMETEAKIQKALETLMQDRTTFIVAQRINTVLNASQIIVLEHGRIAAQGTHKQLIETNKIYQEIYHSQLGNDQ